MNSSPSSERLSRRINELRIKNASSRKFIPEKAVEDNLREDEIAAAVARFTSLDRVAEVTEYITGNALRVFCVLVLINQPTEIQRFIEHDQLRTRRIDDQLPLTRDALRDILDDDLVADLFDERQWEVCVPVFRDKIIPRHFAGQTILPYLREADLGNGAFGDVYRVSIHPQHQPAGYSATAEFVRKEIKSVNDTYENEVRVLSMLQRLAHPNILRLVACYSHNGRHNLVSPFVGGGTLRGMLERDKAPGLIHGEMFYLISGLASAIWALHEFVIDDTEPSHKGLHQDLHPDNILYDGERLILADFGLSSIKLADQNSHTLFKGRKGYCQAPECASLTAPFAEHGATRASDIFALGCIIADFLVYAVRGPAGVKSFRGNRGFDKPQMRYFLFHKGTTANEAVSEYLAGVASDDGSPSIKLTIQFVAQMLEIDPEKRPSAREVASNLYNFTTLAYGEKFTELYARFRHVPDSIIEEARFQSWIESLDTSFWHNSSGPTNVSKIFDATVDTLRLIKRELEAIQLDTDEIDCRSFVEIRQLNTKLLNMLPSDRRSTSQSLLSSIILANIGSEKDDAIYKHLQSTFGDSKITQMAVTKQIFNEVEEGSPQQVKPSCPVFTKALSYTGDSVGPYKVVRLPKTHDNQPKLVLVETIECHDHFRWQRLRPRVYGLAELLSRQSLQRQLRTVPFYGLHLNESAFSFNLLYDIGQNEKDAPNGSNPRFLGTLLAESKPEKCPSLEMRFKLASTLAESLAAFHDVNWFHKDLTSLAVLFFPSEAYPTDWITQPYLIGFQHSRSTDDFSEGPLQDQKHHRYHHPAYISTENHQFKSFQRQYDYYSLGILLLEIGFWKTIDTVMNEHSTENNITFSESIISSKLPLLEFWMGSQYVALVAKCLVGLGDSEGESDGALKTQANVRFKRKVVEPLRSLSKQYDAVTTTQDSASKKRPRPEDEDAASSPLKKTKLV